MQTFVHAASASIASECKLLPVFIFAKAKAHITKIEISDTIIPTIVVCGLWFV
jgi:hypothetical protein